MQFPAEAHDTLEADAGVRAGVCGQRRLDAGRPRARRLGQQQPVVVQRAVLVVADGGAVPRRGARHVLQADVRGRAGACGRRRVDAGRPRPRASRSTAAPGPGGCRPRCRRMRRRRCSSQPRRTTPSQGRRSGSCRRLRAATPGRRSPTCPTSRSTAAPVSGPSCRVSTDGGAIPRRGARHRVGGGGRVRAGVGGQRRLDAGRPRARRLAQQHTL